MSAEHFMTDDRAGRAKQAADWFVRIASEDISEADTAEWLAWGSDPRNAAEYNRICDTWVGVEQLRPEASGLLESLAAAARHPVGAAAMPTADTRGRRRWIADRLAPSAVAVGVLAAVIGAGLWYAHETGRLAPPQRVLATAITNRSAELPDGSTLTLAPRTHVAVDFSGPTRKLALSQGEAYFKVHPNKARPFVVRAGELTVTAVGTGFDVRSEPGRAVVTVQEGVVDVSGAAGGSLSGSWRVTAGYQVTYDAGAGDVRLSMVDPAHALGWREGRLQYFDEPLAAVVADVSRYANRPIDVADPAVGQLAFTGTVFVDSIDDWLASLQSTFPVRAVATADHRIRLISSAAAPGSVSPSQ